MPEFIRIPKDIGRGLRSTSGELIKGEKIETGHEGEKQFVDATVVRNEKERYAGSYVKKKYGNYMEAVQDAKKIEELKSAGVPTPDVVRYFEEDDNAYLLITDLSKKGENYVWSMGDSDESFRNLRLNDDDYREIQQQLEEISMKASDLNFTVASDAFFLVKPKKEGTPTRVFVGDIGMNVKKMNKADPMHEKFNNQQAARFLETVVPEEKLEAVPDLA